jgi:AraC-like DNA-binding protein
LEALWGTGVLSLRDRLAETREPSLRLDILEEALIERLTARNGHAAVTQALSYAQRAESSTVAQISTLTGLSARRLGTLFHDEVGIPPKLFVRLRRFQRALRVASSLTDWGEIAATCGYCDQSHLIRDFGDFAGMSPTAYARRRAHHPNHVTS